MLTKSSRSSRYSDSMGISTISPSSRPKRQEKKQPTTQILYELRVWQMTHLDQRMEIWQLPSSLSPNLAHPVRIAGLGGRNLRYFTPHLRRLWAADYIEVDGLAPQKRATFALTEETALLLGLAFRVLAPMRNRDLMRQCLQGIEAMSPQEASYWLGMAMHRPKPRRVLKALRILLNETH